MKILSVVTMAAVAGVSAWASEGAQPAERRVVVCVAMGLDFVVQRAESMAASMFVGAGVQIEWRRDRSCPPEAIRISFADHTHPGFRPGVLAYALPYEGTHIRVFWDRLPPQNETKGRAALLAHVLVHEITHILQGTCRHSESGVMKAGWKTAEYNEMAFNPLPFTEMDVILIHKGLDARDARDRAANSTPSPLPLP
jgi:hypothetical protein